MKIAVPLLLMFWVLVCTAKRGASESVHGGVLTLHECIAECLKENPKLLSEQYTLSADKENIWNARSNYLLLSPVTQVSGACPAARLAPGRFLGSTILMLLGSSPAVRRGNQQVGVLTG